MLMFSMPINLRLPLRPKGATSVSQHPRGRRWLAARADKALDEAIDIAVAGNGRLTILSAIPHPPAWANSPARAMAAVPLADELERESDQAILRDAVGRIPESVPVTKILTHEPIRSALLERSPVRPPRSARDGLSWPRRDQLIAARQRQPLRAAPPPIPVLIVHAEGDREPQAPQPEDATAVA